MSEVTVTGNLTRDPEVRFTNSGTKVAVFGLAVSRSADKTDFFDVSCYQGDKDALVDNIVESLFKGTRAFVSGRLEYKTWTDKSGETKHKVGIVAYEVGPSLKWATAGVTRNERS